MFSEKLYQKLQLCISKSDCAVTVVTKRFYCTLTLEVPSSINYIRNRCPYRVQLFLAALGLSRLSLYNAVRSDLEGDFNRTIPSCRGFRNYVKGGLFTVLCV